MLSSSELNNANSISAAAEDDTNSILAAAEYVCGLYFIYFIITYLGYVLNIIEFFS